MLLYQAYLKGETDLEPEIKSSLFRRVNLSETFAIKIRMVQSDGIDNGRENFQGEWDNDLDVLFPSEEIQMESSLPTERKDLIASYKAKVLKLL